MASRHHTLFSSIPSDRLGTELRPSGAPRRAYRRVRTDEPFEAAIPVQYAVKPPLIMVLVWMMLGFACGVFWREVFGLLASLIG